MAHLSTGLRVDLERRLELAPLTRREDGARPLRPFVRVHQIVVVQAAVVVSCGAENKHTSKPQRVCQVFFNGIGGGNKDGWAYEKKKKI